MKFKKLSILASLQHALYIFFVVILSTGLIILIYYFGLSNGYNLAKESLGPATNYVVVESTGTPSSEEQKNTVSQSPKASWGGPDLWEAVNERRVELGVNPLATRSELCTLASIRLNELLDLGTLDGHEGFSNMPERRPDLKWIYEKYNLTEFLVAGAESPQDAVSLWENTLGHQKLLNAGEYVWGCIYAQNSFAVAITAF